MGSSDATARGPADDLWFALPVRRRSRPHPAVYNDRVSPPRADARARRSALRALLVVFGLLAPQSAGALLERDIYRNPSLGVQFTVPEDWMLTSQTGYPSLLALLTRDQAKLSVSLAQRPPKGGIEALVRTDIRAMGALGIIAYASGKVVRARRRVWRVAARSGDGTRELRLLYLVHQKQVFIFTLSSARPRLRALLPDLEYVLESLQLEQEEAQGEKPEVSSGAHRGSRRPPDTDDRGGSLPERRVHEAPGELESDGFEQSAPPSGETGPPSSAPGSKRPSSAPAGAPSSAPTSKPADSSANKTPPTRPRSKPGDSDSAKDAARSH